MERKKHRRFSGLMRFVILMIFSYGLFSPVWAHQGDGFSFRDAASSAGEVHFPDPKAGFSFLDRRFSVIDGRYAPTDGVFPIRHPGVPSTDGVFPIRHPGVPSTDGDFPIGHFGVSTTDGGFPIGHAGIPSTDDSFPIGHFSASITDAGFFFKDAGSYAIKDFGDNALGLFAQEASSRMPVNTSAGGNDYTCRFYEAYVSGEMGPWPALMNQLKADYRQVRDSDVLYDLLIAYYGYIAWLIGVEKEDRAKDYLEEARSYLETLEQDEDYTSYAASLKGAFLAYEIGMNRSKAVWLGPKSMKHINRAVELDGQNPIAWIEKGNAEYHMPRIFGGSYHKAAKYFHRAIRLFENQSSNLQCNWRYLNALAWLAQSYDRAGEPELALQTYQKILEQEPRFEWVKDELYPAFKKEHPELTPSIPK